MEEIWKDIAGFEGRYQISNLGRVKSLAMKILRRDGKVYTQDEKILKLCNNKKGYPQVRFCINRVKYTHRVHRLVANTFLNNSLNKPEVNHINGIKTDNRVSNLEWSTAKENSRHAHDTGLRHAPQGEKHGNSLLSDENVIEIKSMLNKGFYQADIANKMNISQSTISAIKKGRHWKHINA